MGSKQKNNQKKNNHIKLNIYIYEKNNIETTTKKKKYVEEPVSINRKTIDNILEYMSIVFFLLTTVGSSTTTEQNYLFFIAAQR